MPRATDICPDICIAILAHNEERRIARCLASVLADASAAPVHVIVNGSTDRTAAIARSFTAPNLHVHEYADGGKARSWNRFVFDTLDDFADYHVFVDGDAAIAPGSIAALAAALRADDHATIAAAPPLNGRKADTYRATMRREHGLFGALYAVRGRFLRQMRDAGIRLPDDLIGDDGLLAALAKTDLQNEDHWDDNRVVLCEAAGFFCEPVSLTSLRTWRTQYRRMINYSLRHFQNRIVSEIMRGPGPKGLPARLASLYTEKMPELKPRHSLVWWHFDRLALQRMRAAA